MASIIDSKWESPIDGDVLEQRLLRNTLTNKAVSDVLC
jgi:hypothetical protein